MVCREAALETEVAPPTGTEQANGLLTTVLGQFAIHTMHIAWEIWKYTM